MIGILFFATVGLWFYLVTILTKCVVKMMPKKKWRNWIAVLFFLILMPMPIIDEIFGAREFKKLCSENAALVIDLKSASGKTVYLDYLPDVEIKNTWLPMRIQRWQFLDEKTSEPVLSYNVIFVSGGKLVRTLHISEGNVPLTLKSFCAPEKHPSNAIMFKEFGINYVQRSILTGK
jgi:UDP-N-acetylmuramyl pentapeptide phosphotransferase/UDP-N-acetylglucosamine-1-phosphate transferase